jgi:hypothetical protein
MSDPGNSMRASFLSRSLTSCLPLLLVLGMGCEPPMTALTVEGRQVRLSKKDAPRTCREVGTVESNDTKLEEAQYKLRNETAERGGNYVRWDSAKTGYVLTGTAFECPPDSMD